MRTKNKETALMNGWTPSLPHYIQRANELKAVFNLWKTQPFNAYWRNRFFYLLFGGVK